LGLALLPAFGAANGASAALFLFPSPMIAVVLGAV
jgi:hypothetical protein